MVGLGAVAFSVSTISSLTMFSLTSAAFQPENNEAIEIAAAVGELGTE